MVEDKLLGRPRRQNAFAVCLHLLLNFVWDVRGEWRGMTQDLCCAFRARQKQICEFTHEGDVEIDEDIENSPHTLRVRRRPEDRTKGDLPQIKQHQ